MAINVPAQAGDAFKLQSEITALAALNTTYAQNLAEQKRRDLVHTLMSQGKILASTIISNVPILGPANPLVAKRTALIAQIATLNAAGGGDAAIAAGLSAHELPSLETQIVSELMASGAMTPASIINHAAISYTGPAVTGG